MFAPGVKARVEEPEYICVRAGAGGLAVPHTCAENARLLRVRAAGERDFTRAPVWAKSDRDARGGGSSSASGSCDATSDSDALPAEDVGEFDFCYLPSGGSSALTRLTRRPPPAETLVAAPARARTVAEYRALLPVEPPPAPAVDADPRMAYTGHGVLEVVLETDLARLQLGWTDAEIASKRRVLDFFVSREDDAVSIAAGVGAAGGAPAAGPGTQVVQVSLLLVDTSGGGARLFATRRDLMQLLRAVFGRPERYDDAARRQLRRVDAAGHSVARTHALYQRLGAYARPAVAVGFSLRLVPYDAMLALLAGVLAASVRTVVRL